jgi:putative Holliday junction resolvase
VLGVDAGERRVGLAISDPSGTIARPLFTLQVRGYADAVARVADEVARLVAEDDGLREIVVGLPLRLDGSPTDQTSAVTQFVEALRKRVAVSVATEDERLTSVEAEQRLATREPDWRKRKALLDAGAAAIILQDYLERSARAGNGSA